MANRLKMKFAYLGALVINMATQKHVSFLVIDKASIILSVVVVNNKEGIIQLGGVSKQKWY
jgi:hypothetical protein